MEPQEDKGEEGSSFKLPPIQINKTPQVIIED
jgi:hypothetical protein